MWVDLARRMMPPVADVARSAPASSWEWPPRWWGSLCLMRERRAPLRLVAADDKWRELVYNFMVNGS